MRRFQSLFALAVSALLSASGSAIAQNSDAYCSNYAREAENAAKLIRDNKCGFAEDHPQWNTDSTAHEKWCLSANHSDVEQERRNRALKVGNCRTCRGYAQEAVRHVALARKYWCQRADLARWSPNENDHFGWCMSLENIHGLGLENPLYVEGNRRAGELNGCLHRNPEYCQQYAQEAVQNANSVRADQCSIYQNDPNGFWSTNAADHLKRCQSNRFYVSEPE